MSCSPPYLSPHAGRIGGEASLWLWKRNSFLTLTAQCTSKFSSELSKSTFWSWRATPVQLEHMIAGPGLKMTHVGSTVPRIGTACHREGSIRSSPHPKRSIDLPLRTHGANPVPTPTRYRRPGSAPWSLSSRSRGCGGTPRERSQYQNAPARRPGQREVIGLLSHVPVQSLCESALLVPSRSPGTLPDVRRVTVCGGAGRSRSVSSTFERAYWTPDDSLCIWLLAARDGACSF